MNTADGPKKLSTLTWQRVAVIGVMAGFAAFVLWLTASHFDATEFKSVLYLSSGYAAREFVPLLKSILGDMSDTFARGGQVE